MPSGRGGRWRGRPAAAEVVRRRIGHGQHRGEQRGFGEHVRPQQRQGASVGPVGKPDGALRGRGARGLRARTPRAGSPARRRLRSRRRARPSPGHGASRRSHLGPPEPPCRPVLGDRARRSEQGGSGTQLPAEPDEVGGAAAGAVQEQQHRRGRPLLFWSGQLGGPGRQRLGRPGRSLAGSARPAVARQGLQAIAHRGRSLVAHPACQRPARPGRLPPHPSGPLTSHISGRAARRPSGPLTSHMSSGPTAHHPSGPPPPRPSGPAAHHPSGPLTSHMSSGPTARRPSGTPPPRPSGPAARRPSGTPPPRPSGPFPRRAALRRGSAVSTLDEFVLQRGHARSGLFSLGRFSLGSVCSICSRSGSSHGGSLSARPSSSSGSSIAKPGASVATSSRVPPGSRK